MNRDYQDKNKTYHRNLTFLKEKEEPSVISAIEEADFPENIEIINTRVNLPTVRVRTDYGQSILLHSAYDPRKEAKNFISASDIEDARFLIVLGFGLGYHVKEILENYPWVKLIVVIEPQPRLFKLAMSLLDFSSVFSSSRIRIILENDPVKIKKEMLSLGETLLTGKSRIITHNPSCILLDGKLTRMKKSITEAIHFCRANLTTNIIKGDIFQKNILTNLLQIISNPGVKNLFGKFKGKPAICVAAGPSLDKNVHLLKKAGDRALIICVDAALKAMLERTVRPDIVVSIDYGIGARNLFRGIMNKTEGLFLAADPEVYPAVLSDFKGKKFIINLNKPLTEWLSNFMEDKGVLDKGASVAHAAFFLAKAIGADPIILVGQDLSYPDRVTHAGGSVPRKRIVLGKDKRTGKKYILSKTKDGKWKAQSLVMVEDIYGKEVPTSEDMYSYLVYFEKLISMCKARCIDATEGGARIQGTEVMGLGEALNKYCREEFEAREILEHAAKNKEEVNLEQLKEAMEKVIRRLKEMHFYAGQGQKIIKKLYRKIKRNYSNQQEINTLADKSNQLKDILTKIEPYIRSFLEQEMHSHLYLARRKTNLRVDKLSRRKKLLNQVEKVGTFYDGVRDATEKLLGDFQEALDNLP